MSANQSGQRSVRGLWMIGIVALGAVALSACAAAGSMGARPQSAMERQPVGQDEARQQLAYYLRQLAQDRRALGLDGADAGPSVVAEVSPRRSVARAEAPSRRRAASRDADEGEYLSVKAKRAARPSASASPAPPASVVADAPTAGMATSADGGAAGGVRRSSCPMPCRRARSICHAARRICSLADYLADAEAQQRCGEAKEDCRRAREITHDRCERCPAKPA